MIFEKSLELKLPVPRVFFVGSIEGKVHNKLFRTLEDADIYVGSYCGWNDNIIDFMSKYHARVIYGVNPNLDIYVFDFESVLSVTNSLKEFETFVNSLHKNDKLKHHGDKYVNLIKVDSYPSKFEIELNYNAQHDKCVEIRNKYHKIIDESSFPDEKIRDNDPDSLMDYLYNEMIRDLIEYYQIVISYITSSNNWEYIEFSREILIGQINYGRVSLSAEFY